MDAFSVLNDFAQPPSCSRKSSLSTPKGTVTPLLLPFKPFPIQHDARSAKSYQSVRSVHRFPARASSTRCEQSQLVAESAASLLETCHKLDDELSRRQLPLDPAGYFVIFVDREERCIVAKHYGNSINEKGVACDPTTGKPIPCDGSYKPTPTKVFRGITAKQLSVAIIEEQDAAAPPLVTLLPHANYLGREFQKAEAALLSGSEYVQD